MLSAMQQIFELRQRLRLTQQDWDEIYAALCNHETRDEVKEVVDTWFQRFAERMKGAPIKQATWNEAITLLAFLSRRLQAEQYARQDTFIQGQEFLYLCMTVPGVQSWCLVALVHLDKATRTLAVETTLSGVRV